MRLLLPHHSLSGMTVLDDKLTIAGGWTGIVATNKVYVLDQGEWKHHSTMPTARMNSSAIGYQSMLITVGGAIKGDREWVRLATTELLDTTNGCWYTCDDLPIPLSQLKSVIANNVLYLLCGRGNMKPSPLVFTASLDNLSSHQLRWQSLPDTPWCFSAPVVLYNKFLLTVGGRQPSDVNSQTNEVYAFNPSTGVWKQITKIPESRSFAGVVCIADNQLIVLGSATRQGQFSTNCWIGICE